MSPVNRLAVDTPEFWDEEALLKEELRQFDVCHGCRLCFNFCPAFPALFDRTDAQEEGRTPKLTRKDLRPVEDVCYQCKLCYIRCPYTEPHELALDVPRLFMRAKFVNKKKDGIKLGDRLLADTDRMGKFGSMSAPMANMSTNMAPVRFVMSKTLGLHPKALLPKFHSQTFASWFKANGERLNQGLPAGAKTVALFYTCTVNYNDPSIGIAAAQVLAHNGIRVTVPVEQQCCGMPFLDAGDLERGMGKIRANLKVLSAEIRGGKDVVVISPTCSLTVKQEYPRLVPTEEARQVAEHTFDVSEYLWKQKLAGKLSTAFKGQFQSKVKKVAYHAPCHIRAQFIGNKGASLMELIPGVEVEQIEQCSAHDGTWGVKQDSHDLSLQYAQKLFRGLAGAEADLYVSDCPLATNQIEHGTGKRPVHPMQVLKEAYGL